jgi:hypothetical protein
MGVMDLHREIQLDTTFINALQCGYGVKQVSLKEKP